MRILWSSEINEKQLTPQVMNEYQDEFDTGIYTSKDIPRLARVCNQKNLADLKQKYNKNTEGNIVVIANIERWSKCSWTLAYLNTNQIAEIFQNLDDGSDIRWFTDSRNLRGDERTKQGLNHYIFREVRENKNLNKLKQRLEHGEEVTPQLLNYYTHTLLDYVE